MPYMEFKQIKEIDKRALSAMPCLHGQWALERAEYEQDHLTSPLLRLFPRPYSTCRLFAWNRFLSLSTTYTPSLRPYSL